MGFIIDKFAIIHNTNMYYIFVFNIYYIIYNIYNIIYIYIYIYIYIRPVNEWHTIALARTHICQYLFRHANVTHAKLYMTS